MDDIKYTIQDLIDMSGELSHDNIYMDNNINIENIINIGYLDDTFFKKFYSDEIRELWKAKVVLSKKHKDDHDCKYQTTITVHYFDDSPFMIEHRYGKWGSSQSYRVFDHEVLKKLRKSFILEREEQIDFYSRDTDVTAFVHINGKF